MKKSHVSMSTRRCAVCDTIYQTGELILDTRLRESLESETLIGLGVCDEHRRDGYVVLVGIDPESSTEEYATRTGSICHIRSEVFKEIFNREAPKEFTFVDEEIINQLEKDMEEARDEQDKSDVSE